MDIIQEAREVLKKNTVEIKGGGHVTSQIGYDKIQDLISRLVDRMEWKPIESAPKDGTVVWGCSIHSKRQGTMYWMEVEDSVLKGYWSSIALCTDKPTHWLPLPPVGDKFDIKSHHAVKTATSVCDLKYTLYGLGEPDEISRKHLDDYNKQKEQEIRRYFTKVNNQEAPLPPVGGE